VSGVEVACGRDVVEKVRREQTEKLRMCGKKKIPKMA
jgi:hypothetical protein